MANDPVSIPITYVGFDEAPISFANSFLVQHDDGEFLLTVGQISPPPITGESPEERQEQINALPFVPIRVLARYGLSRRRMVELIEVLQANLEKHDARFGPDGGDAA